MLLYCRAAPPPNLGPWPCLALGEEPLANRWHQRSTADRPGAQRPSQGPDIQPATGTRVGAQTRAPSHSPRHAPAPLRDAPPEPPRSLRPRPPPQPRSGGAPESLFTSVYKCVCTPHTRACHMPTRSCVHTAHIHVRAHARLHTRVHTPQSAHPPHLHVCTHLHSAVQFCKKKALHVCVCVRDYLHPRRYLGLCSHLHWEVGRM